MKISFIATVFNEEKTIESFLDSLRRQTLLPDEIIIVDSNSTDRTVELIKNHKINKKIPVSLIIRKSNRSKGRNFAIQKAKGEIITTSDAGCILDKDWVKKITNPFINKEIDVVSGFYYPIAHTIFEKALSTYTCVMPDRVDPDNFLPSSRSVAFRKTAWKKVGGYPEELDTCEDLVFDKRLKEEGFNFYFEKDAFVHWPQRENIIEAFKQFLSYAKGDGEAWHFRRSSPFLFGRYFIGLVLLIIYLLTFNPNILFVMVIMLIMYFFWSIAKNYRYVDNSLGLIYLPVLQVVSDIAVMSGMGFGMAKRVFR